MGYKRNEYIPPEVLDEIKAVANIVEIINDYVPLKRVGKNYVALCPFHQEDTPSFTVSEEKQIFHCFGCGAGGNVFTFLMKYKQCTFYEAVAEIAQRYGIDLSKFKFSPEESRRYERLKGLYELNKLAMEFFHNCLLTPETGQVPEEAKTAREYFFKRGIKEETLKAYKLGYAPSLWNGLTAFLNQKGADLRLAAEAGLVIQKGTDNFYDRFRKRIMFPITDNRGRVIAFGGRVLDDSLPKYINSPETPVYKKGRCLYGAHVAKEWCQKEQSVILVEGYFDLLSLHASGIKNVVASLGTALTPAQGRILKNLAPRVVVLYDADTAGQKAAVRTLPILLPLGLEVEIVLLPEGDDPDSFIQRDGVNAFYYLYQQRQVLLDWYLREGEKRTRHDLQTRMDFLKEAYQLISLLPNPLKQKYYEDKICSLFGVKRDIFPKLTQRKSSRFGEGLTLRTMDVDFLEDQIPIFDKKIIKFLLQYPQYLKDFSLPEVLEEVKHPATQKIFQEISAFYSQHHLLDTDILINRLDETCGALVARWCMEEIPEPPEEVAKGFLQLFRKKRLKKLSLQIEEAEKIGDWEKLTSLLKQQYTLARELKGI